MKKDNVAKFAIPPFPSSVSSSVSESHNTPATKAPSSFPMAHPQQGFSIHVLLKIIFYSATKTNQDPLQIVILF